MKDVAKGLAGTQLGKWMDGRPSSWQAIENPSEPHWFAKHSKIESPQVSKNEGHFSTVFKNVSTTSKMDLTCQFSCPANHL